MTDTPLQEAKRVVREHHRAFDMAGESDLANILATHTHADYDWRGVHPFNEKQGVAAVIDDVWRPLRRSFRSLQRRESIFFAGDNHIDDGESIWVAGMGHLMGLFDEDWLGIPATRKPAMLRYAEFHRVDAAKISATAFFCDIVGIMQQAGLSPLPPQTAAQLLAPGPLTNDGIVLDPQAREETDKTLAIVNRMIADLSELNESGIDDCPPELLEKSWHDDMAWYGPAGIGSTYTIARYQEQHQRPFRTQLRDKVFNGHVARIAEGNYAGFFGWPNLTNTPTGGFLGLPGNDVRADMRVVDIYRRSGDKLAENWVFIDLLHWCSMQGLDLLARIKETGNG